MIKKQYQLIAFDAYGTLLDVYSIGELADSIFPGNGFALSLQWRERQIEYTRLISLSDPSLSGSKYYLSFWDITQRSLRYVCKRMNLILTIENEQRLMDQYAKLVAYEDSLSVLRTIKDKGISTAILSNGNADMLDIVAQSNGFKPYLDKIVTIGSVRIFKTAPQTYALLEKEFSVKKEDILFVSSNAWDALGAKWYGLDVFWVNRFGHPFEEIGIPPDFEGSNLSDVIHWLNL
jgi:2-haloacid dehalogenase